MSDNNMNGKDFLLGAVVGGIIGAVTALLLAPKPGSELRSDIRETVDTVSARTQEIASQVSERGQVIAKNVGERSQIIAKNVGAQTSEWVDKAKELAGTVVTEVKGWKGSLNQQTATSDNQEEVSNEEELVK